MRYASFLIKPASSLCNLRCKYCFYAEVSALRDVVSYGIMTQETTEAIVRNIYASLHEGDDVTFAFQGGEPTLAQLSYFEHFVQTVAQQPMKTTVHYALQTNGLLLDADWCAFLARHHFLVGLSLDGAAAFHDENRVDASGRGTYTRVLHAKQLLEQFQVETNILWVLTQHHARYPAKIWSFLCTQNIQYVQFIPCLSDLDGAPSAHALQPHRFASFYTHLFRLWQADFLAGRYRSVKFFDDLFHLLHHRTVTACGFAGQCQTQCVLEADGSLYPCDFYVTDAWRAGSLAQSTLDAVLHTDVMQRFLARPRTHAALCDDCTYQTLCGGGCVRMRHNMYLSADERYCGYRAFLQENADGINAVLRRMSM